jgi:hypothetical protein
VSNQEKLAPYSKKNEYELYLEEEIRSLVYRIKGLEGTIERLRYGDLHQS